MGTQTLVLIWRKRGQTSPIPAVPIFMVSCWVGDEVVGVWVYSVEQSFRKMDILDVHKGPRTCHGFH